MATGKLTSISYKFEKEPVTMCFDIELNGEERVLSLDFNISCRCEAILEDYTEFRVKAIGIDLSNINLKLYGDKVEFLEQEEDELQLILELKISRENCFFISDYECHFNNNLIADKLASSPLFKNFLKDSM